MDGGVLGSYTMNALSIFFLLTPTVGAVLAGVVVAVMNRNEVLEDSSLIRQFVVVMLACSVILFGASKTHSVRMRIDPVYKLQTELNTDPVLQAIKEHAPDDGRKLEELLVLGTSEGHTLAQAKALTRPVLVTWARYRVGFAEHKATLQWAQVHIDALKELRDKDPALCVQYLLPPTAEALTGLMSFSAANTAAFEAALIELYASAHRKMGHTSKANDPPVDLEVFRAQYGLVADAVWQRHGLRFGEGTAKATVAQLKADTPKRVCDAYIFRLETMQASPAPVAARLLQAALRD
jgi:hypothetical protein